MSCARVQQYTIKEITSSERHNERKNTDYSNINVDTERIGYNVHFKDPGEKTYMQILKEKEERGELSRRGLREDAYVFDEIVFDVNTMYFHENGGYEFAKEFYEEAYRYACIVYGEKNIVSAVMHADELNKAATKFVGYPVYHYHLHVIAFPVVEKEVLWSKRCKDHELVGTVKEVIHQISHSKKWESKELLIDDQGNPEKTKTGKPIYRKSYSVLQDEFYKHMVEHGYEGFIRGKEGSTVDHLSSLEYQVQKEKEQLSSIQRRVSENEVLYESALEVFKTNNEIESMGRTSLITKNVTVSKEDFETLTALAKEGISSRYEIERLSYDLKDSYRRNGQLYEYVDRLQENYDDLQKKSQPYMEALRRFPEIVSEFVKRIRNEVNKELLKDREKDERDI